ncbi:MAG: MMPL family transporter [Eubacteriales bacterium]|nr:MMPL family transporter [Eubacteriales bacterium]
MKIGKPVVKCRYIILIVSLILLIPSVIGMRATRVNYDMLTYLPEDMETMKGQKLLQKDFGKGAFSLIVVENMKSEQIEKTASDIKKIDHVESVINLEKVIDPNVPISMYPEQVRKNFHKQGATILAVFFDTDTSAEPTINAITQIRNTVSKNCYVSGMSALVTDLKAMCEAEEAKYVGVAVLLALAAMMLLLDSYVVPFIFLLSIGVAILFNMGSNIIFGEISYITKAIAAVLQLAVTMDYSIFLWHSYTENLEKYDNRNDAMAAAIDNTLVSVTGSSVTTIAGFLALCAMSYTMGKDLGLVMAKGCLLGVIVSVTVLPSMILLMHKVLMRTRHKALLPDVSIIADKILNHYVIYLIIFAVLLVPAIIGYNNENVIYDFSKTVGSAKTLPADQTRFLTANEKLRKDFNIETTHMIIADADLSAKDGAVMSKDIEDVDGVQTVLGIDALTGGTIPREILPQELTDSLIAKGHQLIMVNSSYKVSTDECNKQIDKINQIVAKYDKTAKVIGEGPATKDLINLTSKDFKVVSWISIAAVFVIILLVLRSFSLPFILVAVIEFAIYINLGIPGYTHLELPFIVPVLISTIQLGSTVDYAILFTTRFKTERIAGHTKHESIEIAAKTCIPSILVSALGFFAATFGVAVYSNIEIISTLCSMMARGALISMICVILVLPALLMALDKVICKTTNGMRDIYKRDAEQADAPAGQLIGGNENE